jgi:hypothetical protein
VFSRAVPYLRQCCLRLCLNFQLYRKASTSGASGSIWLLRKQWPRSAATENAVAVSPRREGFAAWPFSLTGHPSVRFGLPTASMGVSTDFVGLMHCHCMFRVL